MAKSDNDGRGGRPARGQRLSHIGPPAEAAPSRGDIEVVERPGLDELRSIRSRLYTGGSPATRSAVKVPKMARSSASQPASSHTHKATSSSRRQSDSESKSRHRKESSSKDDEGDDSVYVYGPPRPRGQSSTAKAAEQDSVELDDNSEDGDGGMSVISEEPGAHEKKVKYVYVKTKKPRTTDRSSRRRSASDVNLGKDDSKDDTTVSVKRRSSSSTSRRVSSNQPLDFLTRSLSVQESRIPLKSPPLKRSNSTSSTQVPAKASYEASLTSAKTAKKHPSLLGGLFSSTSKPRDPPRLVECLTCLSDDIPQNKSAKLKCGHRMCHSCLKRIFKLSVNDPQHMPPKCCTSDHIPLKHVDKLFDIPFKKTWNKKYHEFSTRDRIYCPAKRCGEWIKPANIHTAEGGKKYGKCSRCKTKVCCLCNGKWHGNKDCPKDEETNRLLDAAKAAGWQRCYNCRTMVELKEGCNHMTCRCTAEFCMICGLKWKSCNCPWFNYEQVENDRLHHMRVAGNFPPPLPMLFRPLRARGYQEEIEARRRQEQLDEDIARRFQVIDIDEDDDDLNVINGVGNARQHFMNDDFRRHPAPRERVAQLPLPVLRPVDGVAEAYNAARTTRPAERVVPRRTRTDYVSEAARHVPVTRSTRPRAPAPTPRPSDLAGLGGAGRGSGRVSQWRSHVRPGEEPEEGVLSM